MGGPTTVHTQEGLRDKKGSVGCQAGGGVDVWEAGDAGSQAATV